jgi:transposase
MKRWKVIHKIKALYDDGNGLSIRAIAQELGMSRTTVSKYVKMSEAELTEKVQNQSRVKELDSYKEYIVYLLQKYPKLSAVKIKIKLDVKGIKHGVSDRTFRRYIKDLKKTVAVKHQRYYEPVLDMVAGVQCQVDPGELRGVLIRGRETTIYFVVFVMSYSRQMYVTATDKPISTKTFIHMHDEAFSYFGGVVEECVYDQTKLVAIKEEFREVWFNEEFYRYATYSRFDIRVCEGYDPESKGKVESGVKYVKNNFFYGEEFDNLEDLKRHQLKWVNEVANERIHGTTKKRPCEIYEAQEREKLKPYLRPSSLLETEAAVRTVDKTSLISYKSNKYSVPMKYQSSKVMVREEESQLVIQDSESRQIIAVHRLSDGKGLIIKNINHYRDHSKVVKDREREVAELIGHELSESLCPIIRATSPKIYKDQLVGLIKTIKNYSHEDMLKEALRQLVQRPQLKVSFIKDYLEAFFSKNKGCPEVADAGHTGRLSSYQCLSQPRGLS